MLLLKALPLEYSLPPLHLLLHYYLVVVEEVVVVGEEVAGLLTFNTHTTNSLEAAVVEEGWDLPLGVEAEVVVVVVGVDVAAAPAVVAVIAQVRCNQAVVYNQRPALLPCTTVTNISTSTSTTNTATNIAINNTVL